MPFDLLRALQAGPVLGDGGILFELERRGYVQAGPFTPEVAVEQPEALLQLHREFLRAGADFVQALTFYGTEDKLSSGAARINRAAVRLAREAAGACGVAGGLSPTPTFRQGGSGVDTLMRRHLEAQLEEGVDFLIGETFLWLEEARLALRAMRDSGLPCVLTMNLGPAGSRDGHSPAECARVLRLEGAHVVGVNCSHDPEVSLRVVMAMGDSGPLACQPIAYRSPADAAPFETWPEFPLELDGRTLTRFEMGDFAGRAAAAGVGLIGGCCGVAPHHVREMARALGRRPQGDLKSPDLERHMIEEVRLRAATRSKPAASPHPDRPAVLPLS